jgi:hypothetical protein
LRYGGKKEKVSLEKRKRKKAAIKKHFEKQETRRSPGGAGAVRSLAPHLIGWYDLFRHSDWSGAR